jgi:hypothetical protein
MKMVRERERDREKERERERARESEREKERERKEGVAHSNLLLLIRMTLPKFRGRMTLKKKCRINLSHFSTTKKMTKWNFNKKLTQWEKLRMGSWVARWFVFKPKVPIWGNVATEDVGILYGHLVYFVAIWHILRLFGIF